MGGAPSTVLRRLLSAIAVIFGLLLTHDLIADPENRIFGRILLMFLGPVITTAGILLLASTFKRTPDAKEPEPPSPTSPPPASAPAETGKDLLYVGSILMAIPAIFLFATPIAGPYREITGMMATLTFLFFGMPGLAAFVFAASRRPKRERIKPAKQETSD